MLRVRISKKYLFPPYFEIRGELNIHTIRGNLFYELAECYTILSLGCAAELQNAVMMCSYLFYLSVILKHVAVIFVWNIYTVHFTSTRNEHVFTVI